MTFLRILRGTLVLYSQPNTSVLYLVLKHFWDSTVRLGHSKSFLFSALPLGKMHLTVHMHQNAHNIRVVKYQNGEELLLSVVNWLYREDI